MVISREYPLVKALDDAIRSNLDSIAAMSIGADSSVSLALTYADLDRGAARIADDLCDLGLEPDEPVLVYVSNLPSDLQSLLGVWRAGAVAVPVHRDSVGDTIASVQSRAKARFVVTGSPMPAALPAGMETGTGPGPVHILPGAPRAGREILREAALVMFTSGSTGEPKGVVLSRDAFLEKLKAINRVLQWPQGLRSLLVLQLNFAFGQWVSFLTLLQGGTLLMSQKFTALACLRDLAEHGVDQVAVVPTMLRAMLSEIRGGAGELYLERLRSSGRPTMICSGGEPLAAGLGTTVRELLPATGVADVFGLTETCTSDFILPPSLYDRHPGSIGFPTPGVGYRIVDPESGRPVGPGETGALEIRSDYMMNGYLDAVDLTAAQFRDDYFKTGDLARVGADGEVRLAGRARDLIVRGGNKVSPIEVDAAIIRHPDVDASLTVGAEDSLMGERIHTAVVLRRGARAEPEELRQWAGRHLDKFKIPDRVHIAQNLPQGRTGKDDRGALLRWLEQQNLLR